MFLVTISTSSPLVAQEHWKQIPVAIHFDSDVSGGKFSIEEIVKFARQNNVKGIVITDHDKVEVEYGLFPLRNIIKKVKKRPSIATVGFRKYFEEINYLDKTEDNVTLIPGAEVTPFYNWEGDPWNGNMKLKNWHRHLLAIGLGKPEDYKMLPTVSNGSSRVFTLTFVLLNILLLFIFYSGIRLFGYTKLKKAKFSYQVVAYKTKPYRVAGVILFLAATLLFLNNFPFLEKTYDQYHGDLKVKPYQAVIDYVRQKGGLTFWAHPEDGYTEVLDGIEVSTEPYQSLVAETVNHDGFAIFPNGMDYLGKVGGLWDKLLLDFCNGRRNMPIWAIAELSFESPNDPRAIRELLNILLVKDENRKNIVDALRNGRMYAVRDYAADYLFLEEFSISNLVSKATIGQEIECVHSPLIRITLDLGDVSRKDLSLTLVKNGKVIKSWQLRKSLKMEVADTFTPEERKSFYRLVVESGDRTVLVSNPVFVRNGNHSG